MPGVARDRPHTNHTPIHTNTSSKPQPGKRTATRHHTHANTHGRHTHTHTTATNTERTHQHAPRDKHTQHEKPPTKHRGNGHHRSQRTPARTGGEPRPGPSARRGEGPPTTNTNGPTARSGGGPHLGPSARRGEGTPTQNPQPEARDHAKQTGEPQPGGAKAHPPPTPEDPRQECRGATSKTLTHSQGGRGTTRRHRRGTTTRGGGDTHTSNTARKSEKRPPPPPPHPGETGNLPPQTTQLKGGRDEKGPRETQARDPISGVWGPAR